ncbi:MAG: NADH-quinone oxidoreductase subunit NuoK [Candidatus Thalassarchaeaceae archaeon]|jgi:NADH-quinone oxidoreductase subunit K|nr:NADH-quinone oxidoreductase subunit NuoK [Candidatus Thalassarchaeaceae archaeon]
MIEPSWIAGLGAFLFCIGLVGVFTRKNAIIVLMCIEIMLNAVNLNFVAGASHWENIDGWVYTSIAIAIAAAEVAVGLAIFLALYSQRGTISLDEVTLLKH